MTQRNNKWLPLALTTAVLLTAAAVWAQPRGGAGRFGPPGAGLGPGQGLLCAGQGLLYGAAGDRLDLTAEQRDEIRGIVETRCEANLPWREDMKMLGAQLEDAIDAEPFDEEAVRALARQLADVRVELAVSRARAAQEVRSVLTPDQRETLGEMRAQRRQLRDGFGGRGSRGFHRRGPGG